MNYDAVIFDLWGTLVPGLNRADYLQSVCTTAEALGVDPEAFRELWTGDNLQRLRDQGSFPSKREAMAWACEQLGSAPSDEQLQRAADIRLDYTRVGLAPRSDVGETLVDLREKGLRLGMMSACSADTAIVWPTLSLSELFDVALLSCEVGLTKPDPNFYAMMFERLGVPADRCLYVGDGAGDELGGAEREGAHPVLINAPGEDHPELASPFTGPRISRISEVLRIIEDDK